MMRTQEELRKNLEATAMELNDVQEERRKEN